MAGVRRAERAIPSVRVALREDPGEALAVIRQELGALRVAIRQQIPMDLRIALRRIPAAIAFYARPRAAATGDPADFPHVQSARSTPLRRAGTLYDPALQAAKEANVRRVAAGLSGTIISPGEVFSWHETLGPPLAIRGFQPGPEVHEGALAMGVGGGACQVANLVYWLGVTSGLAVIERHRHGLDLFPDDGRDVPFGCGATVFHPHRDLKLRNPGPWPVLLELEVEGDALVGRARMAQDPGIRWEIVEASHRFRREGGAVWRENRLVRRRAQADGQTQVEALTTNRARVCYPVPEELIDSA